MPTVLITGAASGIGRDTARLFASAGWQCVLVDHNGPALQAVGDSLPTSGGAAHLLRITDLTDTDQVASLREGTPTLDAIVNNAGMSDASNTPLVDQDPAQMGRLLALNTCSNCHSLSATGMRPLRNYFSGMHTEADVAEYLQAALSGGNTLYMPQIPFNDDEARALAAFILTTLPADTRAVAVAKE